MKDILQEIVANKRIEVAQLDTKRLYKEIEELMASTPLPLRGGDGGGASLSMKAALAESKSGIIAEFKRKSPSKGWIKEDGRPEIIPPSYAANGAAALSILTDEKYFGGCLDFLKTARPLVSNTPILRKDFIIDEFQLYEAKIAGADAVLLIAADLTLAECKALAQKAHELNLETLLEIHTEAELDYVGDNIDMVGVNNRNLGTFHTDVQHSFDIATQMREVVKDFPNPPLLVSESGISNPETVRDLRQAGFRGFLIGETFMKTEDPGAALRDFIKQVEA